MRRFGNALLATAIALGLSGVVSAAQWRGDNDRDDQRGWYNGPNSRAYQDGVSQGQRDRANNRRYNPDHDWDGRARDEYLRGYDQGYNGGYYGGGYRDGYGRNYPYPNQGPYAGNYPYGYPNGGPYGGGGYGGYYQQAYQQGFQDGRADGQHDAFAGHSYRPTHDDNYKHAMRGYNSSWGNRHAYKQEYRSGYVQGYQQGYQNGGYGRGRW